VKHALTIRVLFQSPRKQTYDTDYEHKIRETILTIPL